MSTENKIQNTFHRAMDEIIRLQKAFKPGKNLEKAIIEVGGDISWLNKINESFDDLYALLEDGHMGAVAHLDLYGEQDESQSLDANNLTEGVLDGDDEDGFMARSQLYFLAKDAIALHGMIDDRDDLQPWIQAKIIAASGDMEAVRRYTEYNAMNPEVEPSIPAVVEPTAPVAVDNELEEYRKIPGDKHTNYKMHKPNVDIEGIKSAAKSVNLPADAEWERKRAAKKKKVLASYNEGISDWVKDKAKSIASDLSTDELKAHGKKLKGERDDEAHKQHSKRIKTMFKKVDDVEEGYKILPPMDPKYVERDGLEGPFTTLGGKVVYYDPKEGSYYDPDTDMYMSYDEFQKYDTEYSDMTNEVSSDTLKKYVKKARVSRDELDTKSQAQVPVDYGYDKENKPKFKKKSQKRAGAIIKARDKIKARERDDKKNVDEGMAFDDKRNDALENVANDMFKHAKDAAKKSLKARKK